MFPTSGLFQDVLCPDYSAGTCSRPYCHFNHTEVVNPVYKPTPISILEKRTELTVSTEVESLQPEHWECSKAIPVYQPTPISELEKYAPSSLSNYGFSHEEITLDLQEQPSYSPVVKRKSHNSNVSLPPDSTYPSYQPTTDSASKVRDMEVNNEVIDIGYDSDEGCSITTSQLSETKEFSDSQSNNCMPNELKSGGFSPPLMSNKKLKRKCDEPCASVSNCVEVANLGECTSESNKVDQVSQVKSSAKRQKFLSLYEDLYGDITLQNPSFNSDSNDKLNVASSSKKKPESILPYHGQAASRLSKQSSDNSSSKKEPPSSPERCPRPLAPLRKSNKIPMPIRTRYLDQFIEECLVICPTPVDAYNRALEGEQACHDKATSRMAYLNAVIQMLKSFKAEKSKVHDRGLPKISNQNTRQLVTSTVTHSTSLSEVLTKQEKADESLEKLVRGPTLYKQLTKYLLTEDDLIKNCFPRGCNDNKDNCGKVLLTTPENRRQAYATCKENERICCRCGARFTVDEFGCAVSKEACIYHWGKPVKQRAPGLGVDLRYLCCQAQVGQSGCQVCKNGHVHDANKWLDSEGFVQTLPPLPHSGSTRDGEDRPVNVFALDCEMVFTTGGCELARITVVNSRLEVILDSIVRPDHTIIDTNQRFSGLRAQEVEQSTVRITDIQAKLLHIFDSDSILVGHSLESDLVALKLIHSKIVDTSIVFPHRLGPPHKRALRSLAYEILQLNIQQDEAGHNSSEDARTCMQLMHHEVKEDLRRGRWALK